jgi:hypothetical protein
LAVPIGIAKLLPQSPPLEPRIVDKNAPMSIRKNLWIARAGALPQWHLAASVRRL